MEDDQGYNLCFKNKISMHFNWFTGILAVFWIFVQFLQLRPSFTLLNSLSIWSAIVYFSFKKLKGVGSIWMMKFRCCLQDQAMLFIEFCNFFKLRKEDLVSWGIQHHKYLKYLVVINAFYFEIFQVSKFHLCFTFFLLFIYLFIYLLIDWFVLLLLDFENLLRLKKGGRNFFKGSSFVK